ncbi:MAG TPA: cell division protein, partial [Eubacterium sp.]|nr:cell division protein [Eubacterium sp.]
NDMIFSIICEELGLFGAVCVIALFIFMIFRMKTIAMNVPKSDLFGSMLVVGVMLHVAIQALLNIAVVTNSMPNTGVSLPFISYGGTSLAFLITEMGLVFSVSKSNAIRQSQHK